MNEEVMKFYSYKILGVLFSLFILTLFPKIEAGEILTAKKKKQEESRDSKLIFTPFQHINEIVNLNNQLASDFFQKFKENKGNILYSPFGILMAVESLLDGAQGKTEDEISQVLNIQGERSLWRNSAFILYESLIRGNLYGLNEIYLSNTWWIQKDSQTSSVFKVASMTKGGYKLIDFQGENDAISSEMNSWIEKNSGGEIKELLSSNELNKNTEIALTSTFNFKSLWSKPFIQGSTRKETFILNSGKFKQVEMISITERFRSSWTNDGVFIELPYSGIVGSERLSFVLLLPSSKLGIDEFQGKITPQEIKRWLANLITQKITLTIPKFQLQSLIPLKNTLTELGLKTSFGKQANFRSIDHKKQLQLGEIFHGTNFTFNEWGSRNRGDVVDDKGTGIMSSTNPRECIVNRPFIFFVYDKFTGIILLMGRVMDPEMEES
jgi:serpin B